MTIQSFSSSGKKKILVLVSRGGGGHRSAAEALQLILGDAYDVEIDYVFQNTLKSTDILNILTRGRFTGEDLYNFFLKHHQKEFLKWIVHAGQKVMRGPRVKRSFEHYLKSLPQRPDLIISPIPFINHGAACAAQHFNIPFLIIPTDLDGSTFLNGFPDRAPSLNFKIALPYDDLRIRETTLQNRQLREEQVVVTGFPVRPLCMHHYSAKEKQNIRAYFNISPSCKIITLVMGAVGGKHIFNHVKSILALDPTPHGLQLELNVCTGNNKKIASKIRHLLLTQGARDTADNAFILPSGLVVHVHGYLPNLIDLMAISDLIITKTGSCTVNEAIYMKKPLLLDNTEHSSARYLPWEAFNIAFVEKYKLGLPFTDSWQLPMLIPSLLKYPEQAKIKLERPSFQDHVRSVVRSMIR
jgi:UDP-N-acetylglucosamine:LPS N-acetylglucosamine transferase